jgi:hypothetical protein
MIDKIFFGILMFCAFQVVAAGNHDHSSMTRALIDDEDITHTAVVSGSWFNPINWQGGNVPGEGAWVHVPTGIELVYDQVSNTVLKAVKVDGHLKFSTTSSSQMIVDTLLIEGSARLTVGTANNPIPAAINVDVLFSNDGDLDVMKDPSLMGRGLLGRGDVVIHGVEKTPHMKVSSDPRSGDTTLQLVEIPLNWRVGDVLVIAGTKYSGWKWDNQIQAVRYHGTQDEVVTVTAIDGAEVTFEPALQYDHITPREDLKTSVANMSRNITFATQIPETTPTHQRGHVMFMGESIVDVRYASFWQLGRTDKSFLTLEAEDFEVILPESNVRGRYAFHLHRKGINDEEKPAIAIGNAVFGSPGWGYVHHDSNAIFHNNVSFDTFGAGFVAETGNEIGTWSNNLAIKAEGNSAFNPKNGNDRELFDMGRTGDGFWFQGRMVRSINNIAASVNHGFVYLHRGSGMLPFPGSAFMFPEALTRNGLSGVDDAPILSFADNESFASTVGLYVVKANPNQQHDIHSHFKKFKAWEVRAGAAMEYTSHYLLEDFDVIGKTPEAFSSAAFGIEFGTNTSDMVINNAHISNMPIGVILSKQYTEPVPPPETNQYVLIDTTFEDVDLDYEFFDPLLDQVLQGADLQLDQFDVSINNGTYEFLSPATSAGSGVYWQGTKTDSIGPTPVPAGTDQVGVPVFDMIAVVSEDGYFRTSDGTPYAVIEEFFTNRATGEIHKLGLKTLLGPAVDGVLGDPFTAWSEAFEVGSIDLNSLSPVAVNDAFAVASERPILLDLLSNDSDPENDLLLIDGIQQPEHGRVFMRDNGAVSYVSDFGYQGIDNFRYWVTDQNGNYSVADVTINVLDDLIFINDFAE